MAVSDERPHILLIAMVVQPTGCFKPPYFFFVVLLVAAQYVQRAGHTLGTQALHGGKQLIHALFPHDASGEKKARLPMI